MSGHDNLLINTLFERSLFINGDHRNFDFVGNTHVPKLTINEVLLNFV